MILYLFIYAIKSLFTCLSKILDIVGRINIATDFIILGPIPSNPIALQESKAKTDADTCSE